MEAAVPRPLAGRLAGALFAAAGLITVVTLPLPAPADMNKLPVGLVGAAAIAIGIGCWFAPWDRWPRRVSLWLVPVAFALIAFGNAQQVSIPYTDGIFFVVAFVWIGIAHPRGTSALASPAAALAYAWPILLRPAEDLAAAVSSTAVVVPACVLVGEALAWVTSRWGEAEQELHDREDAVRRALASEREIADRLRSVEDLRSGMLQAVSHEIRTPLTVLLGLSLTFERKSERLSPEKIRELSGKMADSARHLEQLLEDLLEVGRAARGTASVRPREIQLGDLVRTVLLSFDDGDRPIEVAVDEVLVHADAPKLQRMIEALLANAVRYTPRGSMVWLRAKQAEGGIEIAVEDEGPGVPDDKKHAIFEPFGQGDGVPEHAPGLGIGLTLVARYAELHGGNAWVEDRPGGGASFRVFVPTPVREGSAADSGVVRLEPGDARVAG